MSLGIVIGKFMPFHRGHALLIERALSECDAVVALVCDAAWHDRPAARRAEWIRASFPSVSTVVLDQDELGISDEDSAGWARATTAALGRAPDVVFTSEDYGARYAELLGARHVLVDRERRARPISGTAIRADPQAHLEWLDPHVRADHVTRVAVLGAESTGKTTLARDVAAHFGVPYVAEFGRSYSEALPDPPRYSWSTRDFRIIAETQAAIEDDTACWVAGPLICDTNPFVTAVFHEAYLGFRDPALEESGAARRYDLFVLCDPRTPFAQDGTGLRVDGSRRAWMDRRYRDYVDAHGAPVVQAHGSPAERCALTVQAIATSYRARRAATCSGRCGSQESSTSR